MLGNLVGVSAKCNCVILLGGVDKQAEDVCEVEATLGVAGDAGMRSVRASLNERAARSSGCMRGVLSMRGYASAMRGAWGAVAAAAKPLDMTASADASHARRIGVPT